MRIAMVTPLPPVRSGIAGYSAQLLPHLAKRADVVVVTGAQERPALDLPVIGVDDLDRTKNEFDEIVVQLGNNPHHEFAWRWADRHPSVIVLHDYVLHHLLTEMTLARGDLDRYREELTAAHGAIGRAWADARGEGFHFELMNFLLPSSSAIAQRSRAVIVHNEYAASELRAHGVTTPIHVVEHPLAPIDLQAGAREATREELGFRSDHRVVGMFGFVTEAKRPSVVMNAFASAWSLDRSLRLLIVGEPASNVNLEALARAAGLEREAWTALGYVADDEFDRYLAASDRVVALRYPTAGETSGALLRVFAHGRPVAVSDYAQFAGYPRDVVTRIPLGDGEIEELRDFMLSISLGSSRADAQRRWLTEHGSFEKAVDGYLAAIAAAREPAAEAALPTVEHQLPLLPEASVLDSQITLESGVVSISVRCRNVGATTLRASLFGEPQWGVIIRIYGDSSEIDSWWWFPEGDIAPGETFEIVTRRIAGEERPVSVALSHGVAWMPSGFGQPFARLEFAS